MSGASGAEAVSQKWLFQSLWDTIPIVSAKGTRSESYPTGTGPAYSLNVPRLAILPDTLLPSARTCKPAVRHRSGRSRREGFDTFLHCRDDVQPAFPIVRHG